MSKYGEIRGCMDVEYEGMTHVEEVDDEFASYFGLYIRDEDGLMMWDSDHETRKDAEMVADEIGVSL